MTNLPLPTIVCVCRNGRNAVLIEELVAKMSTHGYPIYPVPDYWGNYAPGGVFVQVDPSTGAHATIPAPVPLAHVVNYDICLLADGTLESEGDQAAAVAVAIETFLLNGKPVAAFGDGIDLLVNASQYWDGFESSMWAGVNMSGLATQAPLFQTFDIQYQESQSTIWSPQSGTGTWPMAWPAGTQIITSRPDDSSLGALAAAFVALNIPR